MVVAATVSPEPIVGKVQPLPRDAPGMERVTVGRFKSRLLTYRKQPAKSRNIGARVCGHLCGSRGGVRGGRKRATIIGGRTVLEALIFDVDGTLAETERDGHRPAFNQAFREAGLPFQWDEETYGRLLKVTGGKERIRRFLAERPDCSALTDADIVRLHRRKTELYTAWVQSGAVRLRPGVRRLIREAKALGLKLAIATTTSPDNVDALLARAGLSDAFDVVGAGDVVPRKKPAPDIYAYVLDRLGVRPDEAIAFEDSENGLIAGVMAGLRVVVTPSHYTRGEHFDRAWALVTDLGEPDRPGFDVRTGEPVVVDVGWLKQKLTQGMQN